MRVRYRGGMLLLALALLTALATRASAQPLDPGASAPDDSPRSTAVGAANDRADAIRLAVFSLPTARVNGHHPPAGVQDLTAVANPIRSVDLRPPGRSAAPEAAGVQRADPAPGRHVRSIPESISFILLATGLVIALSRKRFKR
jgi:hypothetical protein